jgi:hypothetical protein
MNKESLKEVAINIVPLLIFLSMIGSCAWFITTSGEEERAKDKNRLIVGACTAHFHNAAKALTVENAHSELAQAELCLYLNENLCEETPEAFAEKMMVLHSLKKGLEGQPTDRATEEAMLQSLGRVLFDGGQYCYKGNCKLQTYPFMCSDVKGSDRCRHHR